MKEDEPIAMHGAQTKVVAELELLRMQAANKTSKSAEVHSPAKDGERPAKPTKVSRGSENSLEAPSIVAYSALLVERDEFKSRFEALVCENQCISRLLWELKELRANIADIEKSNAPAKSTPTKGQNKKRPAVAEKCVVALEAELRKPRMRRSKLSMRPKDPRNVPPKLQRSWLRLSNVLWKSR